MKSETVMAANRAVTCCILLYNIGRRTRSRKSAKSSPCLSSNLSKKLHKQRPLATLESLTNAIHFVLMMLMEILHVYANIVMAGIIITIKGLFFCWSFLICQCQPTSTHFQKKKNFNSLQPTSTYLN